MCRRIGGHTDLRVYNRDAGLRRIHRAPDGPATRARVLHRILAHSRLAFGYVWRRSDFPWLGIWEENHSRAIPPWNGRTLTRGMEFGASPIPETRRKMIERGRLFGVPGYRWIPAKQRCTPSIGPCWSRPRESGSPPPDGRERYPLRVVIRRVPPVSRISMTSGAFNPYPCLPRSGRPRTTCGTICIVAICEDRLAGFAVARHSAAG